MLTIKQITEQTELVLKGLKKKHFSNAEEVINKIIELNNIRKKSQAQLDNNLAESKKLAAGIGQLMKAGQAEEAEKIKAQVAVLKETNKELESAMTNAENEIQALLYTVPNIPYDAADTGERLH